MRTMKIKKPQLKLLVLALLAPFAIQGNCEQILTQDPREHFLDGKMPKSAFRFANQVWEIPSSNHIIARLLSDQKNPHLVRVGVMDNGVDIAHPDLVDQIDFGTDGKRIVSAGHDIMGGDRFGSPAILHLEYYAFGAEDIVDNKIKGAIDDPIGKLRKYDQTFLDSFIPKLKAHPILGTSLYGKFTKENFSILAAQRFAIAEFDTERYAKRKRDGDLIGRNWKPKPEWSVETLRNRVVDVYPYLFEELELGERAYPEGVLSTGAPEFMMHDLEHGDEFYRFAKAEFEAFSKTSGYAKDFDQLMRFMEPRLFDFSKSKMGKITDSIDRLAEILVFSRKGYKTKDPLLKMGRELYVAGLTRKIQTLKEAPTGKIIPTAEELRSAISDQLKLCEDAAKYAVANPSRFTVSEIEGMEQYLQRQKTWTGLFEEYLSRKNFDPVSLRVAPALTPEIQSKYRKMLTRTYHPMIDSHGVTESHGTHVSGIIAKQNPDIRIVPLRVITRGTKKSPVKDAEMFKAFETEFKAWLREPLVVRALEGRFSKSLNGKKGEVLVTELLKIFAEKIPEDFEANKLDFRFLGEVEQAIVVAGQEKLKLVNVSLGTTFDRAVIDYRNLDVKEQIEASYDFLKFEYLKWKVAKTANTKSPNTLFLVATGNDGAWRDGRSKSALPVDLSSSFLADYEDASKGLVAPNNQVKNILGVGSLSQLDEISSFSNILLSKSPMVMAHGEQVLSPIRSISDEAVEGIFSKDLALAERAETISDTLAEERMDDFLIKRYGIKGTPVEVKEKLDEVRKLFGDMDDFFQAAETGLRTDLFVRFPNARARYSGTSMATPTLTGILANEINLKAKALGIPAAQIYAHADFSPTALIQIVKSKSESMFGETSILKLRKWTGKKPREKTADELALDDFVKKNELKKSELMSQGFVRKSILELECERLLRRPGL